MGIRPEQITELPRFTHGGRRAGSGRRKKPDWITKGLRLQQLTNEMLAEVAHRSCMSQSSIANNLLEKELRKILRKFKNSQE
jgi:hypothetical protein